MERLDLTPLSERAVGERWRRFRAETRAEFWSIRARRRYRMAELARVNGLEYEPVATPRRPKAHIFTVPPHRVHSDRFSTPRFVVGNYEEIWDDGQSETRAYQHSYVVFQLRESYPRTLVAHTLTQRITWLKNIEPVPGPDRRQLWSTEPEYPLLQRLLACGVVEQVPAVRAREIEIVGNELFVLRGGHLRLDRPQVWKGLDAMADALAPFLAPAAGPDEHNQVATASHER